MKYILTAIVLQAVALHAAAADAPSPNTSGSWYLSSESSSESFDSWQISSGYSYPVYRGFSLVLGTQMSSASEHSPTKRGLLSGIEYNFSPYIKVGSALFTEKEQDETNTGVSVSSHYQLTDKLNLHASFDYHIGEDSEKEVLNEPKYQLGVSFRF